MIICIQLNLPKRHNLKGSRHAGIPRVSFTNSPKGLVVERSCNIAKRLGVQALQSHQSVQKLLSDFEVVPKCKSFDFTNLQLLCRINRVFPKTEAIGIGEFYIDLKDHEMQSNPREASQLILEWQRELDLQDLRLGVGGCKFIARLSAIFADSNSLKMVLPRQEHLLIQDLDIRLISSNSDFLNDMKAAGIQSFSDLRNFRLKELRDLFSVQAILLFNLCRGIDPTPVYPGLKSRQLLLRKSFQQPIYEAFTLYLSLYDVFAKIEKHLHRIHSKKLLFQLGFIHQNKIIGKFEVGLTNLSTKHSQIKSILREQLLGRQLSQSIQGVEIRIQGTDQLQIEFGDESVISWLNESSLFKMDPHQLKEASTPPENMESLNKERLSKRRSKAPVSKLPLPLQGKGKKSRILSVLASQHKEDQTELRTIH